MPDLHPPLHAFTTAFALTATALPVAWGPLTADVIWDGYQADVEGSEAVEDYDVAWAAFRKDQVADIQPGDTFTAPRLAGAAPTTARIVRVQRRDPEFFHVAVVELV